MPAGTHTLRGGLLHACRGALVTPAPLDPACRHGRYFYATLHLGTPARQFAVIVDTGSTITYVPCASCGKNCGPHHKVPLSSAPPPILLSPLYITCALSVHNKTSAAAGAVEVWCIPFFAIFSARLHPGRVCVACVQDAAFDPSSSTSSVKIPCGSEKCLCGRPPCGCSDSQECTYQRTYGARSAPSVLLSDPNTYPRIFFRCARWLEERTCQHIPAALTQCATTKEGQCCELYCGNVN